MLFKYLIVLFVSMVPIVELRGAVPIAVGMNLPYLPALVVWWWSIPGLGGAAPL